MKKTLNIASAVIHALYFAWCISGIILCVLYHFNYDTDFGSTCANLALDVCCLAVLGLVAVIPLLLGANITSIFLSKQKKERIIWIVISALSPFVVLLIGLITAIVLVMTTGGV